MENKNLSVKIILLGLLILIQMFYQQTFYEFMNEVVYTIYESFLHWITTTKRLLDTLNCSSVKNI